MNTEHFSYPEYSQIAVHKICNSCQYITIVIFFFFLCIHVMSWLFGVEICTFYHHSIVHQPCFSFSELPTSSPSFFRHYSDIETRKKRRRVWSELTPNKARIAHVLPSDDIIKRNVTLEERSVKSSKKIQNGCCDR